MDDVLRPHTICLAGDARHRLGADQRLVLFECVQTERGALDNGGYFGHALGAFRSGDR
jgi:hypothetical protein